MTKKMEKCLTWIALLGLVPFALGLTTPMIFGVDKAAMKETLRFGLGLAALILLLGLAGKATSTPPELWDDYRGRPARRYPRVYTQKEIEADAHVTKIVVSVVIALLCGVLGLVCFTRL